jgi:hypothetical protein
MGLRQPPGAAGPGRPYGPCRGPSGPGGLLGLHIFEAAGADISDPGEEHAPAWPPVRSRSGWRTGGQLSSLSDQRNHVLGILGLPDLDGDRHMEGLADDALRRPVSIGESWHLVRSDRGQGWSRLHHERAPAPPRRSYRNLSTVGRHDLLEGGRPLRVRFMLAKPGDTLQRHLGSSHRRQRPELARLHLTWARNRRRSVALHLRRLRTARYQRGRTQPARRRPPVELPAMIGYIDGCAVAGLPQGRGPPVFRNRAQAIAVASISEPTVSATSPDTWTCSLQRKRSASKECLVNGLRIRAAWHSECHSRQVR